MSPRVTVTWSVETDDRVVMDDAAVLVFGDLDESDPHLAAQVALSDPGQAGELARQVDGDRHGPTATPDTDAAQQVRGGSSPSADMPRSPSCVQARWAKQQP